MILRTEVRGDVEPVQLVLVVEELDEGNFFAPEVLGILELLHLPPNVEPFRSGVGRHEGGACVYVLESGFGHGGEVDWHCDGLCEQAQLALLGVSKSPKLGVV